MKKNQDGFSVVEMLVVIVIIGIIGFIGMYIRQRNNTTKTPQTQKTQTIQKQTGTTPPQPFTYTLPSDWSQMACPAEDVTLILLYPNGDKATDCGDHTNLILVSQGPNPLTEPAHCLSSQEVETYKQSKPLLSYSCTTLTINGEQVIKETRDQGPEPDEGTSDVTSVGYEFVKNNKPINFIYWGSADGNLLHPDVAEQIVKTVKLN